MVASIQICIVSALQAGRTVALANKESLVAGGALVTAAAAPGQLVPVDSEHSALAQCLRGGSPGEVARLVLTASGHVLATGYNYDGQLGDGTTTTRNQLAPVKNASRISAISAGDLRVRQCAVTGLAFSRT